MSVSRVSLQAAYVLHHRPYRDTSVLLEVFTRDHGRVGLVAKGVRTSKSRTQGLLHPFRPLLISWAGRGELVTLTSCEGAGPAGQIGGRLLMSGFYVNELLLRLLHRHDAHPALFEHYAATLLALEDSMQEQRALRIFEKHLLHELGYALMLNHQADTGEPLAPERIYSYQLEQGPRCYDEFRPQGIRVHGASLLSLASEELCDPESLRETKHLLRASLSLYLGDKPLQSRKLLSELRKTQIQPQSGSINPYLASPDNIQ
ncbi:MAG: DNA repair protein RecO [Gammaproteobacteria bacterium]